MYVVHRVPMLMLPKAMASTSMRTLTAPSTALCSFSNSSSSATPTCLGDTRMRTITVTSVMSRAPPTRREMRGVATKNFLTLSCGEFPSSSSSSSLVVGVAMGGCWLMSSVSSKHSMVYCGVVVNSVIWYCCARQSCNVAYHTVSPYYVYTLSSHCHCHATPSFVLHCLMCTVHARERENDCYSPPRPYKFNFNCTYESTQHAMVLLRETVAFNCTYMVMIGPLCMQ